jgi:hypothetical protein
LATTQAEEALDTRAIAGRHIADVAVKLRAPNVSNTTADRDESRGDATMPL